ncbi:hypothetical protein OJ997_24990 [Solirubrobacter phytolaccae]|uniref:Nitroreductase n=1 Tax=Solirubrobacter phytolaccae TaxID=1404360 RepID=A0A9X3S9N6_9ACTN|nr:hypothetical protein [Solirubrobacter phytolaccae]MDA0183589.1 hypothetical protein [Solirubrobacter phytolaccae]
MKGPAYSAWQDWQVERGPAALVAAAVLAANPHNSQAWTFQVGDDAIDVFADLSRSTGALDPFHRELYVGLGCALENLLLAAYANGYAPTVTLLPAPGHAAHVALAPGPTERGPLYEAIPHRHTDRSAFAPGPLPAATLTEMAALAEPGTRLVWAADTAHVGRLMVDAARAVTRDEAQSRDSYRLFRSSRSDIRRHKDGLTLDVMGMPALTTAVAKLLPATSRSRADAFWVKNTETVQTRTAAAYGFVAVPDAGDDRARITGGRLLQRVHLWATANGLALGHMNQLTERADRERELGLEPVFTTATQQLVPDGWELLAAFRLGYPSGANGRRLSPRRPAAEVAQPVSG